MEQKGFPIAAVARETGLASDTLRVWERRYGFPQPQRDNAGIRTYPTEQLDRLRLIARLVRAGHRPRHIVALPMQALLALQQTNPLSVATTPHPWAKSLLALVQQHDPIALRDAMAQQASQLGLARFVAEVVTPTNVRIGEDWLCGKLQVFEEHLYTECLTRFLSTQLQQLQTDNSRQGPRIVLTTVHSESHGLGLLMAQISLTLEGCHCIALGLQLPLDEIAKAAQACAADIVGLSFSAHGKAKNIAHDLQKMRALLPETVQLWAGGNNPFLATMSIPGVTAMPELASIPAQLKNWQRS